MFYTSLYFFKNSMKKFIIPFLVISSVILLDQVLKLWIHETMTLGQERAVFGNWFYLHYTENPGMAFGMELSMKYGKLILTGFRLVVVIGIIWYLIKLINEQANKWFIICVSLVVAGAMGNIIDSTFYGVLLNNAPYGSPTRWFHGRVIDMLYFPVIEGHFPEWFPIWKGEDFVFFRPVFNLADTSISTGVISIFVFQKRFFAHKEHEAEQEHSEAAIDSTPQESDINHQS